MRTSFNAFSFSFDDNLPILTYVIIRCGVEAYFFKCVYFAICQSLDFEYLAVGTVADFLNDVKVYELRW